MDSKLVTLFALVAQAWAASLPYSSVEGVERAPTVRQVYHPNMTTMWMSDEQGNLMEVSLVDKPGQNLELGSKKASDYTFYFLYTRESNSAFQLYNGDVSRLQASTFDCSRPTKVLIHGFTSEYQSDSEQVIREAYLKDQDVNVIAVDWSALAKGPLYNVAAKNTQKIGEQVGLFIDWLVSMGANVNDFHLLGHSLGAHVAGFTANHVTSGRITRITGLDPALPLFGGTAASKRLDPTDADIVDCVHTCGGFLGFYDPLCTHDFYPNGGEPAQPGCTFDVTGSCSHGRSYRYFAETIGSKVTAQSCNAFKDIKKKRCNSDAAGLLGDASPTSAPGLYYLKTNKKYPYLKT